MNSKALSLTLAQNGIEHSLKFLYPRSFIIVFLLGIALIITLSLSKCIAQPDSVSQTISQQSLQIDSAVPQLINLTPPQTDTIILVIPAIINTPQVSKKFNSTTTSWHFISPIKIFQKFSMPANNQVIVCRLMDGWKSWMFYLLLVLAILLVFLRLNYFREFGDVFQIFKPLGINQQIFRDNFGVVKFGTFLLSLNSSLVIGVYFFLVGYHFHFFPPYWWILIITTIIVNSILFFRFIIMRTAAILFPFKKEINFYQFNEVQLYRVAGVLLLPFLIIICFAPIQISLAAIPGSFILMLAIIFFRYARGFSIGSDYFAKHKFHFIVYICTLEIAPLMFFAKLIKEWAKGL